MYKVPSNKEKSGQIQYRYFDMKKTWRLSKFRNNVILWKVYLNPSKFILFLMDICRSGKFVSLKSMGHIWLNKLRNWNRTVALTKFVFTSVSVSISVSCWKRDNSIPMYPGSVWSTASVVYCIRWIPNTPQAGEVTRSFEIISQQRWKVGYLVRTSCSFKLNRKAMSLRLVLMK